MSMLDQIGREKRRITEQLTRLDAERAKLSDQINELEIAQRAVRRFGDKAVATKKRSRVPAPKTAPTVGAERTAQGGQQAQGISLGDATLRAVRARPSVSRCGRWPQEDPLGISLSLPVGPDGY